MILRIAICVAMILGVALAVVPPQAVAQSTGVLDDLTGSAEQEATTDETPTDQGAVELTDEQAAAAAALPAVFEDLPEWEAFSQEAGETIQAGQTTSAALADLRVELVDWRDIFLARQSTNSARIATVQDQIDALGTAPDIGEEDPRVIARRAALTERLQELRAPARLADEAYTRANGLIGEIDAIVRDRQAQQFTERLTSPLVPTTWGPAISAFVSGVTSTAFEVTTRQSTPSRREDFTRNLPAILALLGVALVLVMRGRAWFGQLEGVLVARTRRGQGVVRFVLSLGQIIIPFLGLVALSEALELSNMLGRRTSDLVAALPQYGLFPILAHWLSGLLLPSGRTADDHPLKLDEDRSARASRRFVLTGYALMAFAYLDLFVSLNTLGGQAASVVMLPMGALLSWSVFWLGHTLRRDRVDEDADAARSFRQSLRGMASRGLKGAAIVAVLLACLGYPLAFSAIVFPAGVTLYVLGILLILQRLSVDGYTLLSSNENAAQDALIPVLIGFALILVSLPILAVIWGAQVTDLTELWARFREGFAIGATRISPTSFLTFLIIFIIGYTVTRLIQAALRSTVLPRTKLDIGGQNAIVAGMGYVGIFLAALIAITTAGIDLSGLAIVAGALSVGIGFGLQTIVSNFVAGIILLIERPISEGDWIEVGDRMGYVRDISVRSTRIETFDKTDVIVPNADLVSGQVTNWTRGNNVGRVIVPVGVAYGTDTDKVHKILSDIAQNHPMVLARPEPSVLFRGFGADSLDFEIRAFLRDVNWVMAVHSDMNHAINARFAEAGIEIPFAQRDVWLRNPETLTYSNGAPQTPTNAAQKDNDGADTPEGDGEA
ncbi:DUF3772 domain-containing protein [Pseudooctadecabacter jejudonensis]|uniref:Putative MscS family protein.1 n=1 Tax=Pseudooctadecabacter jejudonensis TaxID=1391910 RepID=A0A1Y5RCT9_9RHOB|nr:DUF3772 domain-containing protein [Pseudooctadecabacter jejudonensis]SLN14427.1 putative MscS family protein.1 precursor [Pseudooctadecabacter jejudonensis]